MSPVPDPAENHHNSIDDPEFGNYVVNIIAPGSSSEEEEAFNIENGGYQPLPQESDNLEEDEDSTLIDYNSLSGLLSALNTHGPTVIEGIEGAESLEYEGSTNKDIITSNTSDQLPYGTPVHHSSKALPEISKEVENLYTKDQAVLWNSTNKSNQIQMDESKENEIKSLMSKMTLPTSAIPSWAKEISDEEWKCQISSRIFGSQLTKNSQS